MAQKTLTTTQKKVLKDRDYAIKDIKQAEFARKRLTSPSTKCLV